MACPQDGRYSRGRGAGALPNGASAARWSRRCNMMNVPHGITAPDTQITGYDHEERER